MDKYKIFLDGNEVNNVTSSSHIHVTCYDPELLKVIETEYNIKFVDNVNFIEIKKFGKVDIYKNCRGCCSQWHRK